MHSFLRTFHPVGQGAFYTEQHLDGSDQLTVVYDCGSLTAPRAAFFRQVATALPRDTVIDLLFISHFDDDHVNGLAELRRRYPVRAVVLPKLSESARLLVRLEHFLAYGSFDGIGTTLLQDPQAFFGSRTQIILIDPILKGYNSEAVAGNDNLGIDLSPDNAELLNIPDELTTHVVGQLTSVPSGTRLRLRSRTTQFWEYVPLNYEYAALRRQLLVQLAALRLNPDSLSRLGQVLARKAELTAAYKRLPGNPNRNSLVVYSGSLKTEQKVWHNGPWHQGPGHHGWHLPTPAGCLYLGDTELNAPGLASHLRDCLRGKWLQLGTLQVPHHGAIGNFNPALVVPYARAIISYGTTNSHGHPSAYVLGHLHRLQAVPILVTEAVETSFYSHFEPAPNH